MNNSEQLPLIADRPLNIQTDEELCAGFGVDVCELRVAIVPSVVQLLV